MMVGPTQMVISNLNSLGSWEKVHSQIVGLASIWQSWALDFFFLFCFLFYVQGKKKIHGEKEMTKSHVYM